MAMNALSYIKNVGKSFGYAAIDTFKDYNPQVTALASSAKDLGNDLYQSIDDFKGSLFNKDESEKSLFDKGKSFTKEFRENLFDDLKTGKWYNKEREAEAEAIMLKEAYGFDESMFDLDAFDDFDFDDDDTEAEVKSDTANTEAIIKSEQMNTKALIDNMDAVGSRSSKAISTATVRSADYIVQSNKESNRALYRLNERGFGSVTNGLAAVNASISSLVALGDPLTKHMQNSTAFYTSTNEYQQKVLEQLDKLVKNTTPMEQQEAKRAKNTLNDFLTADGTPDLSAYFGYIKESIKALKDDMQGYVDMLGGPDAIMAMAKGSPMKMITQGITKGLMPQMMKESMKTFNDSLGSFFGAAIDRASRASLDGPLGGMLDMVREAIFPKSGYKNSVRTDQLKRGKASWDTESEMALKQVIPTYLASISAALTGQPMTRFDYKTGKYVSMKSAKAQYKYIAKERSRRAGGDLRYDINNWIKNESGMSKQEQKQYQDEMDEFFLKEFESGNGRLNHIMDRDFNAKENGVSDETLNILRSFINAYSKQGKKNKAMEAASSIRLERDRYGDDLREIEADADNIMRALFDNSKALSNKKNSGGIFGLYEGKDAMFYLNGIYNNTLGKGGKPIGNNDSAKAARNEAKNDTENGSKISNKVSDSEQTQGKTTGYINDSINNYIFEEYANESKSKRRERDLRRQYADKKDDLRKQGNLTKEAEEELDKELEAELNKNSSMNKVVDTIKKFTHSDDDSGIVGNIKSIYSKVSGLFNAPATVVTEILAAGETSMYKLIYGKDSTDDDGLFAYFMKKADALFEKFEKNSDKKYYESFKEWMKNFIADHGGRNFWEDTKGELKNVKDYAVNKGHLMWTGTYNGGTVEDDTYVASDYSNLGGAEWAATGSGLRVKRGGKRYSGGASRLSDYVSRVRMPKGDKVKVSNRRGTGPRYTIDYADPNDTDLSREDIIDQDYYNEHRKEIKNKQRDEKIKRAQDPGTYGLRGVLQGVLAQFTKGFEELGRAILPNDEDVDKVKGKLDNQYTDAVKKNFGSEVVKNRGSIGAGALIGAGVSVVTGALVGPIGGAAIGAGIGLLSRSDKLQDALFGEKDENGDRKGGVFSKKTSDFITQNLPSMGIGAGVGNIIGKLIGGPVGMVGGTVLGGAIGYVQSSEKAKKYLFGDIGEDGTRQGGAISKKVQDLVKKSVPAIGAGALAGGLFGLAPIGLVGNIVLGGALGFVSTTDKFKDFLFGKEGENGKRSGGVTGWIREYFFGKEKDGARKNGIFVSLRGITEKLLNEANWHIKNFFSWLQKEISEKIVKSTAKKLLEFIGKRTAESRIGRTAKKAVGVAGKVVSTPVRVLRSGLSAVDNQLNRRALRRGYNVRNDEEGRMMTAAERTAERRRIGFTANGNMSRMDEWMANASEEDLRDMLNIVENYSDPTKQTREVQTNAQKNLYDSLSKMDEDSAGVISRLITGNAKTGDDVNSVLNSLDPETRKSVTENISALNAAKNSGANSKSTMNFVRDQLSRSKEEGGLGFDIGLFGEGGAERIADMIRNELKVNFTDEKKAQAQEAQDHKDEKKMQSDISKVQENTANMVKILRETLYKLSGQEPPEDSEFDGTDDNTVAEQIMSGKKGNSAIAAAKRAMRENKGNSEESDNTESTDNEVTDESASGSGLNGYSGGAAIGIGSLVKLFTPTKFVSSITSRIGGKFISSKLVAPILTPVVNPLNTIADAVGIIKDKIAGPQGIASNVTDGETEGKKHTHVTAFGKIMQTITGKDGEEHVDLSDSETKEAIKSNNIMENAFSSIKDLAGGLVGGIKGLFGGDDEEDGKKKKGGGILSTIMSLFTGGGGILGKIALAILGGVAVSGIISAIWPTIKSAGEDMWGYAKEGDLTSIWSTQVFDTSGGGLIEGLVGGIGNLVVGSIEKVVFTIPALFVKAGSAISNFFGSIKDCVTKNASAVASNYQTLRDVSQEGNVYKLWTYNVSEESEEDGNVVNWFTKTMNVITKFTLTPYTLLLGAGKSIFNGLSAIGTKVSSTLSNISGVFSEVNEYAKSNGVVSLWKHSFLEEDSDDENDGNPIGPFAKATVFVAKLFNTPTALMTMVGQAIHSAMTAIVGEDEMDNFDTALTDINELASEGDISSIIGYSYDSTKSGILGGFMGGAFMLNKGFAIVKGVMAKISNTVGGVIDWVSEKVGWIADKLGISIGKAEEAQKSVDEQIEDTESEIEETTGMTSEEQHEAMSSIAEQDITDVTSSSTASESKTTSAFEDTTIDSSYLNVPSGTESSTTSAFDDVVVPDNLVGDGSGLRRFSGGASGSSSESSLASLLNGSSGATSDNLDSTATLVQNKLQRVVTDFSAMNNYANAGNTSGVWNYSTGSVEEASSVADNPISGYMDAIDTIGKLYYTPSAILANTGNSISTEFSNQVSGARSGVRSLATDLNSLVNYMKDGDASSLYGYDLKVAESSDNETVVGNYMNATGLLNKILYGIPTLFNASGKSLYGSMSTYTAPFKDDYTALEEKINMMDDYASEGKVSDIWNNITYTPDSDNIMGSFFNSAFEFNKIFYVAASITNKLFGFFGKVVDDLRDTTGDISDGATWLFSKWQDWFGGDSSTSSSTNSGTTVTYTTTTTDDDSSSTSSSSSSSTSTTTATTAAKRAAQSAKKVTDAATNVSVAMGSGISRHINNRSGYRKFRKMSGGASGRKICFVGDSRTVGMKNIYGSDGNTWICEIGKGYSWFNKTAASQATSAATGGVAVVVLLGVNDMYDTSYASKYVTLMNNKAATWISKGATVYYVSVNPVAENGYHTSYGSITNTKIESWNSTMKSGLDSKIKYIDTYSVLMSDGYTTVDGIHYNEDTYKKIYELVTSAVNGTSTSTVSSSSSSSSTSSSDSSSSSSSSSGNWLTQLTSGLSSIVTSALGGSGSGTTKSYRPHASMHNRVMKAMRLSGSGSGLRGRYSGGSSNDYFVSQLDSKYSGKSLGSSNVGSKGCGPAAATMMSNYLKPGSMSMDDAVNSSKSYQDSNGTEANYFGDVLGKQGISTSYIDSSTDSGKNDLVSSIASGRPTTLLGRDPSNTSKDNSPFGPNNHYVMATGFDKKGNVIVDDPENSGTRTYSSDILNNVSLGVSADGSGMGYPGGVFSGGDSYKDNTTTQNVWSYFTSAGYSPEATAGIMGNLYQESGIDPTAIQSGGKGPAAGIAQWENYNTKSARWANLNSYAGNVGKDWTNLDTQLKFINAELTGETYSGKASPDSYTSYLIKKKAGSVDDFKNLSDVDKATKIFEESFERAGTPAMENRYKAAAAYYNKYSGSTYTGNYGGDTDDSSSSDSTSSSSSSSSGNWLTQLISGLGDIITTALGGTSSSSSSSDSTSSSSSSGSASSAQEAVLNYVTSRQGTLNYSQQQRNPDNGSADCSSMVYYAYKNVLGKDIGTWTNPQSTSDQLETVQQDSHATYSGGVNNQSAGPDTSKLQPGDLLFYDRGSTGNPYRIGHVEMYDGEGHRWGMRTKSEIGPQPKDITSDASRFVMARRLKDIDSMSVSGSGSGLLRQMSNVSAPQRPVVIKQSGGASNLVSSDDANEDSTKNLLKKLVTLVTSLVENTSTISNINDNITTITNYYNEKVASSVSDASNQNSNNSGNDAAMKDLINTMNTIAIG